MRRANGELSVFNSVVFCPAADKEVRRPLSDGRRILYALGVLCLSLRGETLLVEEHLVAVAADGGDESRLLAGARFDPAA